MAEVTSILQQYKSALEAQKSSYPGTDVYDYATKVVEKYRDQKIAYVIRCMICDGIFHHVVTCEEGASYLDEPRGICGNCSAATEDTVEVTIVAKG